MLSHRLTWILSPATFSDDRLAGKVLSSPLVKLRFSSLPGCRNDDLPWRDLGVALKYSHGGSHQWRRGHVGSRLNGAR